MHQYLQYGAVSSSAQACFRLRAICNMYGTLADAVQRKRAADAECRGLERQLKLARRRDNAAKASSARAWALRGQLLHETLLMYVHADGETDLAVQHLMCKARQYHWPDKAPAEIAALVSSACLAADLDTLASLCNADAPSDELALKCTMNAVQQWSLAAWVKEQNYKGVAPPTATVLDRWEHLRASVPENVRPATWGTINDVAARMRATRWRRRFGGRRAKLPCREDVPLPDMQGKAPLNRILSPARHLHTTRLCYQSVCVVSTLRPLSCIAPERFLAHSCVPPCLRCAQRSGYTGKKNGTETRPRIRYQKQDRILGRPKELLLFSKTSD